MAGGPSMAGYDSALQAVVRARERRLCTSQERREKDIGENSLLGNTGTRRDESFGLVQGRMPDEASTGDQESSAQSMYG